MNISFKTRLSIVCIVVVIGAIAALLYHYTELMNTLRYADTSTQANRKCNIPGNKSVWLISYADGEAYIANQRALTASGLNNCVDSTRHYGPHSIDPKYFEKHKSILTQKRGAGYWLWKPYVILKTLEEIPENDFVLYMDTGALLRKPVDSLISHLGDLDILIFKSSTKNNIKYIKRDLLQMMNMDNQDVRNALHLQAGLLLIRNTKKARDFIKAWLMWSENERAITDLPSVLEHKDFIDHRHDQAILTLLYIQHPENIVILSYREMQEYIFHHRRRNITDRSLIFPIHDHMLNFWQGKINYDLTNSTIAK